MCFLSDPLFVLQGTLEKCCVCKQTITDRMLRATGNSYHPQCFTCVVCHKPLEGASFIVDKTNQPHCVDDYHRYVPWVSRSPLWPQWSSVLSSLDLTKGWNVSFWISLYFLFCACRKYAPRCSVCAEPIMPEPGKDETVRVVALEKNFHMKCYKCEVSTFYLFPPHFSLTLAFSLPCSFLSLLTFQDCGKPLSIEADDNGCFPLDGHVLCRKCHTTRAKAAVWGSWIRRCSQCIPPVQSSRPDDLLYAFSYDSFLGSWTHFACLAISLPFH